MGFDLVIQSFVGRDEALIGEDGQALLDRVPVLGQGRLVVHTLRMMLQSVEKNVGSVIALKLK